MGALIQVRGSLIALNPHSCAGKVGVMLLLSDLMQAQFPWIQGTLLPPTPG